jgi:hypothetical protein
MIFSLFVLYAILRLAIVVLPIAALVLTSIVISIGLAPCVAFYGYLAGVSESEVTCPIPYTKVATLPFSRFDDFFLIPAVYCTAVFLSLYSLVLFLVWLPIGAILLLLSSRSDRRRADVIQVYKHLIGNVISFNTVDVVEFLIWPIGLPRYILSNLFEG